MLYTPTFTVRRPWLDGTLRSVLDSYLPATGTLQALWSPSRHQSPKVRAFVDDMAKHLLAEKSERVANDQRPGRWRSSPSATRWPPCRTCLS